MLVTPIKTPAIVQTGNITEILDAALDQHALTEKSILVITSKIVSILEGSVISITNRPDKEMLIQEQADQYIDPSSSKYGVTLTIKEYILIASSGIDESNGNGKYILWPKDPFASAKKVWEHLRKKYSLTNVGVLITDSRITPLRWGTIGVGIAWCGFQPLNNYIGTPDIFGHQLRMTKQSVLDGLAASAVLCMGEGAEQTPLCTITAIPFVNFTDAPPTATEIQSLRIEPADDIFAPLLTAAPWKRGKSE